MHHPAKGQPKWLSAITHIAYFAGFLFSVVVLGVLVNSCYKGVHLHASGYTAEAVVVTKLRKSKVQIQFTDAAGVTQSAVVSLPTHQDRASLTVKYSPEYPGAVVSCELVDIIMMGVIKALAFLLALGTFFALFPYSWFKKTSSRG